MRNLFRILVIKGINWCVFICCINLVYLNCQPYCLFIVTLDTPTLCLCKVYTYQGRIQDLWLEGA